MKTVRLSKISFCVLAFALLAGCRTAPVYNIKESSFESTNRASLAQIEKAIVKAATSLGWSVKYIDEGKLSATLNIKGHQAVTVINFDADSFSITYKDSKNLQYDGDNIHGNYNKWIRRLENAIKSHTSETH